MLDERSNSGRIFSPYARFLTLKNVAQAASLRCCGTRAGAVQSMTTSCRFSNDLAHQIENDAVGSCQLREVMLVSIQALAHSHDTELSSLGRRWRYKSRVVEALFRYDTTHCYFAGRQSGGRW